MKSIAVSGCGGFIGRALVAFLQERGIRVVRIPRQLLAAPQRAELAALIGGCGAIVHCAGLTPRRNRNLPESEFDFANRQLTRNLADAASDADVPRFVFVSTIAVIGASRGVLRVGMPANPAGAYGRSKAAAEADLMADNRLQSIIVRPPLVYGPGAKGDLDALIRLCDCGWPLPFGAVDNRRSMLGVANLADALYFAATTQAVGDASQIHHACDAEPLSLRRIISTIRTGLGRRPNLLSIPPSILRRGLRLARLNSVEHKLLDDLVVDASGLIAIGWRPPEQPETDLHRMVRSYREARATR